MNGDSLFDEIARILASPIPRRQAFKLIAGLTLGALMALLLPRRAYAGFAARRLPVQDYSVAEAEVAQVIHSLRKQYGAPVSFIDAGVPRQVRIDVSNGTVQDVLHQLLRQAREYRMIDLDGRLIVLPDRPEFRDVVRGIDIAGTPRLTAAQLYVDTLRERVKGFDDLVGTALKGNPNAPLFTAPVTLSRQAPVLQHLVQLLGNDPGATFAIQQTKSGKYIYFLEQVQPALTLGGFIGFALCRALSVTYSNEQTLGCPSGQCGAKIQYDVTAVVTCPGDNCAGGSWTETVTSDDGCLPGSVTTGPGCPIGPNNTIENCTDTYWLCANPAAYPAAGCTETYTQHIFVNGLLTQTCQIVFKVTNSGGACSATVSRVCDSQTQNQCCGTSRFPVLCPKGQICINNACCPAASACNNNTVCCPSGQVCINNACCPQAQTCSNGTVCCPQGQVCVGGSKCCPSGTTTVCNNACCNPGEVCVNNACCPSAQACNNHTVCCPSGQVCFNGTKCCPPGVEC